MSRGGGSLTIRAATPADTDDVLALLAVSLGWSVDAAFRTYFEWKHDRQSPAWVAVDGDTLVGYRAFVRWPLECADRPHVEAARAVDAATRPDARGRGVFSALTEHAIEALRTSGTEVIFTTPNDKAGAGWIKAGARSVGRLPVSVRPRSPAAVVRMVRSRGAADRWPVASSLGQAASAALADPRLDELLGALAPATGLRTRRTPAFLRWRYGLDALGYRVVAVDDDPRRGLAIFRLRRRGAAVEAALCDVLARAGDRTAARDLARRVARASGGDYVIKVRRGSLVDRVGAVALPRQGPRLYAMALTPGLDLGTLDRWDLALGDVELL